MSPSTRTLAAVLLVTLAACGGDAPEPAPDAGGAATSDAGEPADAPPSPTDTASEPSPTRSRELASLTCDDLESQILPREPTRRTLRDAFGEPDETSVTTEPNRHDPQVTDSLFTLTWPGSEFRVRKATGDDFPVRAEISEPGVMEPDLIGVDTARVVEVLGQPRRRSDGELVYDCGMGASEPVTLYVEDGAVTGVRVSYYVD